MPAHDTSDCCTEGKVRLLGDHSPETTCVLVYAVCTLPSVSRDLAVFILRVKPMSDSKEPRGCEVSPPNRHELSGLLRNVAAVVRGCPASELAARQLFSEN